ncbi:MAG: sugar ABC transporter substrate-binding protein [Verrucomicrobia bacterium]|nr:sugar ABC transporter substrate-binding protein [Verrucomicrobiota bacterium]
MQDQEKAAKEISIAVSRRKAFAMATKLGLGSAAVAGGLGTSFADNPPATSGGLPKKNYKFVFVNHVTTNEFFAPTIYGIQDACAFYGCSYQWTGSQNSVVSEMVNAMQTAIAGKADGIAVCLIDATAFDAPTAKALDAGIPVIGYNADVPAGSPNKRLCYVGQPLYQSGYNIASRWLKLVPKGGHVMLSIPSPGTLNLQPRLDGYIQAIKDHGNPVSYDVVNSGVDQATELSRIESYYLSHKDVAGLFGTGGGDTYACGFVSAKYGLAKKNVIVAGYDLYPQTLGYINSGDMTFTTDQQPYLQGFVPLQQMYLYKLSGGAVAPADTNTSLAYVTKDNVHLYLGKSRFEGSSNAEPT